MKDTTIKSTPRRRSVRLTATEVIQLRHLLKIYNTKTELAEFIGISREVLDRLLLVKSASQETIEKIRERIKNNEPYN